MIKNLDNDGEISFADIIDFLIIYKKPILIVTLAAGLLAFIFSLPFFIPPKFKSSVILYPAKTSSVSRSFMGQYADQNDIAAFGVEEDCEKLLQILESDEIVDLISKKYDLYKHYEISNEDAYRQTNLKLRFKNNVTFRRTEYLSVEISVLDVNNIFAANMANEIARLADSVKNAIQRKRAKEALVIIKARYEEKEDQVKKEVDSLQKLGTYGVLNYEEQGSVLTEQYARALMSNQMNVAKELKEQEKNLAKYGPIHKNIINQIEKDAVFLTELEQKYAQARMDAEKPFSQTFIINKAVPAEKKATPLRGLIIGLAMLCAFASSILVLAIYSNYKRYLNNKLA